MDNGRIIEKNRAYWNANADLWFGMTALPQYGPKCADEDELRLFGDVSGKKLLEVCCGSGHSLKYHADRGAGELWGVDLSQKQLENAKAYLAENGYSARLICSPMEELEVPEEYFDCVYSIFGIGWTTDLRGTFDRIYRCLKRGGVFIFSWHHTLRYCVEWSDAESGELSADSRLIFNRSYFDESYFTMPVHDSEVILCNRRVSTYINALADAGFVLTRMVEQSDSETTGDDKSPKAQKAKMMPITVCFRAVKL